MGIKGYKVFNPDWTCRDFQYELGKTYKHDGDIEVCDAGFHFCQKLSDCFDYYSFNSNNKVAEIEALGDIKSSEDKSVTNEIKIVKELNWYEVLDLCNTGNNNSGRDNSGDYNSGNCNSGDYNSGICNSGDRNSGNYNSGDYNSGWYNSGWYNSGNCNSGDWNSGMHNSGFFNSANDLCFAFNKVCDRNSILVSKGYKILTLKYTNNWWVSTINMTDEEKEAHPEYKATGGYLKTLPFKEACALMWGELDEDEKLAVKEIPNFDADVFKEITGIDVNHSA